MLFVGASVTRGWYVTTTENGYPAVAARTIAQIHRRDVEWKVTALPGATVQQTLSWNYPTGQDLVVIDIVTNDFLRSTPMSSFEASFTALLQKLRQGSPKAGFVCLGDWGKIGGVDLRGESAYSFDQIVSTTCRAFSGIYVPINQIFDLPGARGPVGHPSIVGPAHDAFHPNDYGDQLIAQAVVAAIEGDPPTEAVPIGPAITEPKSGLLPSPSGGKPSPISGHESPQPKTAPPPSSTP